MHRCKLTPNIPLPKCAPGKNACPPNKYAFLNDVMSRSELTTPLLFWMPAILLEVVAAFLLQSDVMSALFWYSVK